MNKLECVHADTCLPDYWGGHHLPHAQIAVWPGMTMTDIRQAIRSELSQGAVAGADYDYDDEKWHKRAMAAVNRIKPSKKGQRRFFLELEETTDDDDYHDSVYAFFVFRGCKE